MGSTSRHEPNNRRDKDGQQVPGLDIDTLGRRSQPKNDANEHRANQAHPLGLVYSGMFVLPDLDGPFIHRRAPSAKRSSGVLIMCIDI